MKAELTTHPLDKIDKDDANVASGATMKNVGSNKIYWQALESLVQWVVVRSFFRRGC